MIFSLLYYVLFKDSEISIGYKFARELLLGFTLYYVLYAQLDKNESMELIWWVIALDIFLLAVLIRKYKNKKLMKLFNRFVV